MRLPSYYGTSSTNWTEGNLGRSCGHPHFDLARLENTQESMPLYRTARGRCLPLGATRTWPTASTLPCCAGTARRSLWCCTHWTGDAPLAEISSHHRDQPHRRSLAHSGRRACRRRSATAGAWMAPRATAIASTPVWSCSIPAATGAVRRRGVGQLAPELCRAAGATCAGTTRAQPFPPPLFRLARR